MKIPDYVLRVARRLDEAGHEAYLVGGALRNAQLGRPVGDYDLASSARPEEVKRLFRRVVLTGEKHGTVTVLQGDHAIEVTTFRSEGTYSDSRRPDHVHFEREVTADLSRRDFTMNAIAMRLPQRTIVDPFDGRRDVSNGIIRAIGRPAERFQEDSLRVLRALRFASQLGFVIEDETQRAMQGHDLSALSAERVREEFHKMVLGTHADRGLYFLRDLNLFQPWFPELAETVGASGGGPQGDLYDHLIAATMLASPEEPALRLAALLHDVGKPRSLNTGEGPQFPGHDQISADMATGMMERLRFPRKMIREVSQLVRHHMFNYSPQAGDAAVRRLIRRVGPEHLDALIRLRRIDIASKRGTTHSVREMDDLVRRVREIGRREDALAIRDLAVGGEDLAEAGIPKGPAMGKTLEFLLESVTDDPLLNSKERLLQIAKRYYQTRIAEPQDR